MFLKHTLALYWTVFVLLKRFVVSCRTMFEHLEHIFEDLRKNKNFEKFFFHFWKISDFAEISGCRKNVQKSQYGLRIEDLGGGTLKIKIWGKNKLYSPQIKYWVKKLKKYSFQIFKIGSKA